MYLCTVGTACTVTCPELVEVFPEGPYPTYISEAVFIATVTLLSIPQYSVMGDVTFRNRKHNFDNQLPFNLILPQY